MSHTQQNVDVVIITILPEEYQAVRQLLPSTQDIVSSATFPNVYAWARSEIPLADGSGAYSVILGMGGRPGTNQGTLIVQNAIQYWHPTYLMLVGIAGGFPIDNLRIGDVVIADVIYGYEYGKIEREFQPRPNQTFHTNIGLLNSATRFYLTHPNWARGYLPAEPDLPKAIVGRVASGDKVVDNPDNTFFERVRSFYPALHAVEMEGAGAAGAVESVAAGHASVGFLMVRGISDMPRPDTGAEMRGTAERDTWKSRAATAAALFTLSFIASGLPLPPKQAVSPPAQLLSKPEKQPSPSTFTIPMPTTSRSFTDRDRDLFLRESFEVIKRYFQQGLEALKANDSNISTDFREMNDKIVCTAYLHGNIASQCKIWIGGILSSSSINYSVGRRIDISADNSMNDWLQIEHDKGQIGFRASGAALAGLNVPRDRPLTPEEGATYLWQRFMALQDLPWLTFSLFGIRKNKRVPPSSHW